MGKDGRGCGIWEVDIMRGDGGDVLYMGSARKPTAEC